MFAFTLKAATTYLETEMDRKTGRGRERRAIRQKSGGTLTAAACVNISDKEKWQVGETTAGKMWREKMIHSTLLKLRMPLESTRGIIDSVTPAENE